MRMIPIYVDALTNFQLLFTIKLVLLQCRPSCVVYSQFRIQPKCYESSESDC